jgi:hypothetical protein
MEEIDSVKHKIYFLKGIKNGFADEITRLFTNRKIDKDQVDDPIENLEIASLELKDKTNLFTRLQNIYHSTQYCHPGVN